MFGWFKGDPVAKLEKEYSKKLESVRDIQRKGDIVRASEVAAEAETILKKIEELKSKTPSS